MSKNVICDRREDLGFPVELSQQGKDNFTVTYGLQVKSKLTYAEAAMEYGRCIMHALACESRLDNRMKHER